MASNDSPAKPEAPAAPAFSLVVIHPFGDYRRGDVVADADVDAVLAGENAHHCNRVAN
ncbi:hypothetical protein [Paraburkholderia xenovorans]|uniref:hypothetical protein n=1 Tax=Paraburkholderia xenovorans TaxID=36873 RepID=UPI0038B84036